MRTFVKIMIFVIATLVTFMLLTQFVLVPYFQKKTDYYNDIKQTHEKKYYYYIQKDSNVREALVIDDLKYSDSLIDYYRKTEKGINPYINFKTYNVPIDTTVYIINYETKDSLIAKVLFHYKTSYNDEDNKVVYMYSKLLHNNKFKKPLDTTLTNEK
jgi:hypothetical protein